MPEFDCSREITLPATPERVREAVATNAGNASWLFPNDMDPSGAGAKAWDRPTQFAIRQEQGDWFNEVDFVIEGRGNGTSTLSYSHCGVFAPEQFETQNEAIQQHTDFYLHTLSEYLRHFDGRPVTYIGDVPGAFQAPATSGTPDGFQRLQRAVGVGPETNERDSVRLTPDGLGPIEGVIDYLRPNFMGIRTADALYCFLGRNALGGPVALGIHSFAPDVDPEKTTQAWQRFFNATFA